MSDGNKNTKIAIGVVLGLVVFVALAIPCAAVGVIGAVTYVGQQLDETFQSVDATRPP